MRAWGLALLAAVALAGCGGSDKPARPPAAPQDVRMAKALREGGLVLLMRHAKTDTNTAQKEVLGDCARQRNLSEEGRSQARAIGRAIKALGVPSEAC